MIVLTTGPASLVRLMRRDSASQHLAPGQVDGHQDQGDQAVAVEERGRNSGDDRLGHLGHRRLGGRGHIAGGIFGLFAQALRFFQ